MNATALILPTESIPARSERRRLPPEIRIGQVLDAALQVFGERGYAAARIDDIAKYAGLSKGGVYAHFESKEAIFEALLRRALTPPNFDDMPALSSDCDLRTLATWIVDRLYAALANPTAIAVFRLMVAEGERVPHLLTMWQRDIVHPSQQALADTLQARLGGTGCLSQQQPWPIVAPAVYVLVMQTLFGDRSLRSLEDCRDDHIALICTLVSNTGCAAKCSQVESETVSAKNRIK